MGLEAAHAQAARQKQHHVFVEYWYTCVCAYQQQQLADWWLGRGANNRLTIRAWRGPSCALSHSTHCHSQNQQRDCLDGRHFVRLGAGTACLHTEQRQCVCAALQNTHKTHKTNCWRAVTWSWLRGVRQETLSLIVVLRYTAKREQHSQNAQTQVHRGYNQPSDSAAQVSEALTASQPGTRVK